jgi:hypothetical protein
VAVSISCAQPPLHIRLFLPTQAGDPANLGSGELQLSVVQVLSRQNHPALVRPAHFVLHPHVFLRSLLGSEKYCVMVFGTPNMGGSVAVWVVCG